MAAKTVSVEAAIEELIMREDGDDDYELSLSDSEEEVCSNDESYRESYMKRSNDESVQTMNRKIFCSYK